jgi:imidazolonepropionase
MGGCDTLLLNVTILDPLGVEKQKHALAVQNGFIVAVCAMDELPIAIQQGVKEMIDCKGQLVTPGLIDCHTHLVYAGQRIHEFKMRLAGANYAEIARCGGGILSTVKETRKVSEDELLQQSLPRIKAMQREGVTTVEIKSGYGLDLASELKILRVARRLGQLTGLRVKTTFLGAHAIPPEYKGNSKEYVTYLIEDVLPQIVDENLVDALDVFCEQMAFSIEETERLFMAAEALSLPIKCHAEQLSNMGASQLAARYGALSCDHLEFTDAKSVHLMAQHQTVAVLLPGAYYFLQQSRVPPIELFREAGVGMAVATDCNPGSSPTTSLRMMMNMACLLFSLSVPEVLSGVTLQASKALGLKEVTGTLAVGLAADLVLWSTTESAALCYYMGHPVSHRTMIHGEWQKDEE